MSPSDAIYAKVVARDPEQPEFHQAVKEVLESLEPVLEAPDPGAFIFKKSSFSLWESTLLHFEPAEGFQMEPKLIKISLRKSIDFKGKERGLGPREAQPPPLFFSFEIH